MTVIFVQHWFLNSVKKLSHLTKDKILVQINFFSMNPLYLVGAVFITNGVLDCTIITTDISETT